MDVERRSWGSYDRRGNMVMNFRTIGRRGISLMRSFFEIAKAHAKKALKYAPPH
jgi:hypothetical protein